jgi:hypothetical protein
LRKLVLKALEVFAALKAIAVPTEKFLSDSAFQSEFENAAFSIRSDDPTWDSASPAVLEQHCNLYTF